MNAVELLKADHDVVRKLFQDVKESDESKHPAIFKKIKAELDLHAHIEEVIFYPKLQADGDKELVDIVLEGIEEHRQMKMFLRQIADLADGSEQFEPKLKVLMEDTDHHVKEEEDKMFPLVKEQFESDVLNRLGDKMAAEKENFKKENAAGDGK
ncbi:MAG: hemerythrin domain-containing protein [Pyrinomonadaceae bacterium]